MATRKTVCRLFSCRTHVTTLASCLSLQSLLRPRSCLPDHHQVSHKYLRMFIDGSVGPKVAALPRVWGRHPPAPWKHAYGIWPIISVSNDATDALFQPTLSRCDRLIRLLSTSTAIDEFGPSGNRVSSQRRDGTKRNKTRREGMLRPFC
jgi:hypothetical protein